MEDTQSRTPEDTPARRQIREFHHEVSLHLFDLFDFDSSRGGSVSDRYHLDLLEEIFYHAVRSKPRAALSLYSDRQFLGGYKHLAWRLAEYQRGLRITTQLANVFGIEAEFSASLSPWYERSLFHLDLGHAALAESQMRALLLQMHADAPAPWYAQQTSRLGKDSAAMYYKGMLLQCLTDALLAQGKLQEAENLANEALALYEEMVPGAEAALQAETGMNPYGRRAVARYLRGQTAAALLDFQAATACEARLSEARGHSLRCGHYAMEHAILLARLGRLTSARRALSNYRVAAGQEPRPLLDAQYGLAQGEIELVAGSDGEAMEYVLPALVWSARSGHLETYLRSSLLWARLQLRLAQPNEARPILQEVLSSARAAEYRICLAEGLVLAGHVELHSDNRDGAMAYALEAIDLCSPEQIGYPWGLGSAFHLAAEVEYRKGDTANVMQNATQAIETRQAIGDPRIANTRHLIATGA